MDCSNSTVTARAVTSAAEQAHSLCSTQAERYGTNLQATRAADDGLINLIQQAGQIRERLMVPSFSADADTIVLIPNKLPNKARAQRLVNCYSKSKTMLLNPTALTNQAL